MISVVVVVTALSGCASTDGDPTDQAAVSGPVEADGRAVDTAGRPGEVDLEPMTTPDAVGDIDVVTDVGQYRHLEGTALIFVMLQFLGDQPVELTQISLRTDGYEEDPPTTKQSLLGPGRRVNIEIELGRARCDTPVQRAEVDIVVDTGSGPQPATLPVPTGRLEEFRTRDCALIELAGAVDVSFGEVLGRDGVTVHTEVVLTRKDGQGPIALDRFNGSVILSVDTSAADSPLVVLETGERQVRVPVAVSASRCDPHGLAGSQRTFHFPTWVAVGEEGDVTYFELQPDEELRKEMEAAISACIDAGGR